MSSSSFRRKAASKQPSLLPGTRQCPSSLLTAITSTGIPSLDDILGGGLPLSCSLLVLAPDHHSAYGELVQKYFIAQGLASGQNVCVLGDDAKGFVKECMWTPGVAFAQGPEDEEQEEEEETHTGDVKVKIAWRYEQMKRFQTTVPSSSTLFAKEYCQTFDLTCRIPNSIVEGALGSGQLICLDVNSEALGGRPTTVEVLRRLEQTLGSEAWNDASPAKALRICIPSFGCSQWGDLEPQEILHFLHSVRRLLRQYPQACGCISLPSHLCSDSAGGGGPGWTQKLGWFSDAAITLSAFGANPAMTASFPSHHGIVQVHRLPAPHTILPPSDKFSMLRGLSSSAVSIGSSGENNLAFKCMRKRLVFETLHLDVEGGVGERRTTGSRTAVVGLEGGVTQRRTDVETPGRVQPLKSALATVEIQLEAPERGGGGDSAEGGGGGGRAGEETAENAVGKRMSVSKTKKKVAFQSERRGMLDDF